MAMLMPRPVELWSIDISYEFCAPHFFDFTVDESDAQVQDVESWFEIAAGYEPSPYNAKLKEESDEHASENEEQEKISTSPNKELTDDIHLKLLVRLDNHAASADTEEDALAELDMSEVDLSTPKKADLKDTPLPTVTDACLADDLLTRLAEASLVEAFPLKRSHSQAWKQKEAQHARETTVMKKSIRALKRNAQNPSKNKKMVKPSNIKPIQTPEDQAFKKQKLDGGLQKQVHKATPALTIPRGFQLSTDKRAQMHRRAEYATVSKMEHLGSPFMSLAEKVQRFYLKTPERFRKHGRANDQKPKMTLTKPKEPELETSHRSRVARVKSAAELEEEILAKLPKFKARPANKKILEAPSLPALPRTTPQLPQFQEFHLKTMERALQHTKQRSSEHVSIHGESTCGSQLSEKKQRRKSAPGGGGHLQISVRVQAARPKTTQELEQEELAKVPKFKARPLNRKIFESRGDLGIFRNQKRQVTTPVEFHFATNERLQQHQVDTLADNFRRLSLDSHPRQPPVNGKTRPEPFQLLTEARGSAKMVKFMQKLSKQMVSEAVARIPKANLLPLTTDFPAVPPKPVMKHCTRPEPFQLESMLRHEQELQRLADERAKAEQQELEVRKFRAQPVHCNVPAFVPERSRKPLTEIKEFEFQVDHRAIQRVEFEKKITEKQNQYKQYKEELEAMRKEEEEKFVKALRKEMIPQARPMPLFDRPFCPQRSSKALTLPTSPQWNLPRRDREASAAGPFASHRKFRMR